VTRIVLDTNGLVSALLFTGVTSRLVSLWQSKSVQLLISREILNEYLRVLAYPKFHLTNAEIRGLIEGELLPFVEIIHPTVRIRVLKQDPSDNKFLECAVGGRASILISGDKTILALRYFRKVSIQSPAEFLKGFEGA
jgi:putative PIN family toxin of toxin-antitoxin system